MSKMAQDATINNKVCVGFLEVNLKYTKSSLQNTITWIKQCVKGQHEWKGPYIIAGLFAKITLVKT